MGSLTFDAVVEDQSFKSCSKEQLLDVLVMVGSGYQCADADVELVELNRLRVSRPGRFLSWYGHPYFRTISHFEICLDEKGRRFTFTISYRRLMAEAGIIPAFLLIIFVGLAPGSLFAYLIPLLIYAGIWLNVHYRIAPRDRNVIADLLKGMVKLRQERPDLAWKRPTSDPKDIKAPTQSSADPIE